MTDAVVLCSGGLDSTTLAYSLQASNVDFIPLFLDYGQHCATTELDTLRGVLPAGHAARVRIVSLRDVYCGSSSRLISEPDLWTDAVEAADLFLPYRNVLLLSAGAAFAQVHGVSSLYAAFINSNHAHEIDCSSRFFDQLAGVMGASGRVEIRLPYRNMTKLQVAQEALKLGVPIGRTYSCQARSKTPCGACPNCVDRLEALETLANTPAPRG